MLIYTHIHKCTHTHTHTQTHTHTHTHKHAPNKLMGMVSDENVFGTSAEHHMFGNGDGF